ncbi:hypothetical protein LINPERPRIM_LOCUS21942, partial [Linum perenne]
FLEFISLPRFILRCRICTECLSLISGDTLYRISIISQTQIQTQNTKHQPSKTISMKILYPTAKQTNTKEQMKGFRQSSMQATYSN